MLSLGLLKVIIQEGVAFSTPIRGAERDSNADCDETFNEGCRTNDRQIERTRYHQKPYQIGPKIYHGLGESTSFEISQPTVLPADCSFSR